MIKKIALAIISLSLANIGFSVTNQEMIDAGNVYQKKIFDKYFNGAPLIAADNTALMNKVYAEIMRNLYGENRGYFDKEFARLTGNRRSDFRSMYAYYSDYVVEYPKFLKKAFGNFLQDVGDMQSYTYTNTYLILETFNLNMNTYLEGEKNAETIDQNVNSVYDYLYSIGDSRTKDDYKKMSSGEMALFVDKEYQNLENILDSRAAEGKIEKKAAAGSKSSLKRLKKLYSSYDRYFDKYIDASKLSAENKEKLKKLAKFENISNLKFIAQSIEKKDKDNDKASNE